jgi:hypothetical protein
MLAEWERERKSKATNDCAWETSRPGRKEGSSGEGRRESIQCKAETPDIILSFLLPYF